MSRSNETILSGTVVRLDNSSPQPSTPDQIYYMGRVYSSYSSNRAGDDVTTLFLENAKLAAHPPTETQSTALPVPQERSAPMSMPPSLGIYSGGISKPEYRRTRPPIDRSQGSCSDCGTQKTPEWRRGPNNKALCNACGLQYQRFVKDQQSNTPDTSELPKRSISINLILNPPNSDEN